MWLVTAVMTWFDARHELDELLDGHLTQAASLLMTQEAEELQENETHVDLPSLHRYAPQVAYQAFSKGKLIAHSANAPPQPMIHGPSSFQSGFQTVELDGVAWRVFAAQSPTEDLQVYVGERMASRKSILMALLQATLWPMLMALPVLTVGVWWAIRQGMQPMRQLGQVLTDRQPQALQPVKLDKAPSEMAPMVAALNGLFDRIACLMESERRFTADAAHELRTPIAAIRMQAQVALAESDDALRRHALLSTLDGCDRITHLVEQLLTLSRLEAGATPPTQAVDLSALARQVVGDMAASAIDKEQTIEVQAEQAAIVKGDSTLLSVLIRNLVDNAIRYSPRQATIKVLVEAHAGEIRLQVEDSGPGLNEADSQRVGDRFFRVLGTEQSGSGLGMSIVKRVASAHLASTHLHRSTTLGGLAVEVTWPASPASSSP